jgi:hypothetical protein
MCDREAGGMIEERKSSVSSTVEMGSEKPRSYAMKHTAVMA